MEGEGPGMARHIALDPARCRVIRTGEATPRDGRAEEARATLATAYRRSLDSLPAALDARVG